MDFSRFPELQSHLDAIFINGCTPKYILVDYIYPLIPTLPLTDEEIDYLLDL